MSATQLNLFDASEFIPVKSSEEQFKSILACLNSIPAINAGGCGISALAIYRWCKQNGLDVSDRPFVVLCEDKWDADHNDSYFKGGDVVSAWYPHIAIEIDGTLYDSRGDVSQLDLAYDIPCEYQLNEAELLEALNTKTTWNFMFNRKSSVPKIEYGLNVDLSDVRVN
jgi:hypothetical protein